MIWFSDGVSEFVIVGIRISYYLFFANIAILYEDVTRLGHFLPHCTGRRYSISRNIFRHSEEKAVMRFAKAACMQLLGKVFSSQFSRGQAVRFLRSRQGCRSHLPHYLSKREKSIRVGKIARIGFINNGRKFSVNLLA